MRREAYGHPVHRFVLKDNRIGIIDYESLNCFVILSNFRAF